RQDAVRTFSGRHSSAGIRVAAALPNQQVPLWLVVTRNFPGKTRSLPKAFLIILSAAGKAILGVSVGHCHRLRQPVLEARRSDARVVSGGETLIVHLGSEIECVNVCGHLPCIPDSGLRQYSAIRLSLN